MMVYSKAILESDYSVETGSFPGEKRTVLYTETAAEQSGCRVCGKCL